MQCPKCNSDIKKREVIHHGPWGEYDGTTIIVTCTSCSFEFSYNEED